MSQWRAFGVLVRADWAREMRRKDTLVTMGATSLFTLFLFSFAIPPSREVLVEARAGILWVTFLLMGTIGIDRAFRGDGDGRLLEGLLLAPVRRATFYYARLASTFVFVLALEAVTLVLFLVLFDQALGGAGAATLGAAAVAATLGFVAVGVLLSALTWSLRGGDVLLRILLFPMLVPVLVLAVSATDRAFQGREAYTQVGALMAFDLVFLGAGHILFAHLVKDVGPQG